MSLLDITASDTSNVVRVPACSAFPEAPLGYKGSILGLVRQLRSGSALASDAWATSTKRQRRRIRVGLTECT